jgi:hypothetical protein
MKNGRWRQKSWVYLKKWRKKIGCALEPLGAAFYNIERRDDRIQRLLNLQLLG